MKQLFKIILCILAFLMLWGCTTKTKEDGTNPLVISIDQDGNQTKSGDYKYYYTVEENTTGTIHFLVDTKKGNVTILVTPTNDTNDIIYTGHDLGTMDFTVELNEPQEYRVLLTYDKFVGDLTLEFSKNE